MKEWLTIPEAAVLVGRNKTNVYEWVRAGRLPKRAGVRGIEVNAAVLLQVEKTVKRGRPVTPNPGRRTTHVTHGPIVYFLRFAGRVKIGTTTRIGSRLLGIPHDELLAYEPGNRQQEQLRHRQFAAYVVPGHREWFEAVPELLAAVREIRDAGGDLADYLEMLTKDGVDSTRRPS
jgi:hypothetical protein